MNLTDEQKRYAVPASAGAITYALSKEFIWRWEGNPTRVKGTPKTVSGQFVAAVVAAAGAHLFWEKADADAREALSNALLPLGAAGLTKIALDRLPWNKGDNPRNRNLILAAGAGLAVQYLAPKASAPTVGMLPGRTFEPPFPPPFGPNFPPEFEG
jgi:hypothetical protein